ncbi:MAG: GNAT family N-acetyltransferase [Pontixanthobacter sp.]
MIDIMPFVPSMADRWDDLIAHSRNGHFMHRRGFMDYHGDRFEDASLMFERGGHIIAVLPQTIADDAWHSHSGLSFGGTIYARSTRSLDTLTIDRALIDYAQHHGILRQTIAPVPCIYHRLPSQDETYYLDRCGAATIRTQLNSVIDLRHEPVFTDLRKRQIRKAERAGTKMTDCPVPAFWDLLAETLRERHDTQPVHSAAEMALLQERFPSNIICRGCFSREGRLLAGAWLFIEDRCVHTQYLATSPEGRASGALDYLLAALIAEYRDDTGGCRRDYFSLGISDDADGLNEGLVQYKSSFGAHAVVHRTYRRKFGE